MGVNAIMAPLSGGIALPGSGQIAADTGARAGWVFQVAAKPSQTDMAAANSLTFRKSSLPEPSPEISPLDQPKTPKASFR